MIRKIMLLTALSILGVSSAHAYIGPGLGAGVFATVIAVIASLFIAVFSIFYYPIKRMLKRNRQAKAAPDHANSDIDHSNNSDNGDSNPS